MNIENHFHSAEVYLEMAKEKFDRDEFAGCLASLVKAYEHNRRLIEHVYELSIASEQKSPAGTEKKTSPP